MDSVIRPTLTEYSQAPSLPPLGWLIFHALIILGLFALVVSVPFESQSLPVEGQPAPMTITAPSRVTYINTAATNQLKQRVEMAVPPVVVSNVATAEQNRQAAGVFFQNVDFILADRHTSLQQKRQAIQELLRSSAPSTVATELPTLTARDWQSVQYWSLHLLDESLELKPFDATQSESVVLALMNTLPRKLSTAQRSAIATIVNAFLTPTLVTDVAATERAQQAAAAKVRPITSTIPAGTIIVRRGQIVTPAIAQELRALGLPATRIDWHQRLGSVLFAAIVVFLFFWYLRLFYPSVVSNNRLMLLLDLTIPLTAVVAKVLVTGHVLLPYFFPLAAVSTLCALLLPTEIGVAVAVVLSLFVGWVIGGSFELTTYYLLTGMVGALAMRRVRRLNDFILTGVYIMLAALLTIMSFRLLDRSYDLEALRNYALASSFNGLLSAALAFGGFVLLADFFGVTTTIQLLELAHPDQKLLRRLMADAPGTYNHSLVVASMVEHAARDIGANALLAKVSALYHDIGKLINPQCFIENQIGVANIHDELRPDESARLIRGHVTQGLRLAKQYRLPAVIRDAILQHHGTMTMPYFLHRALQADPNADAELYTYPGPRPQSKECALLMLADGCESAVRANPTHTPESIRDTVNRIVDERIASGQLSECPLTLRDLALVRQAFVDVLTGLYHPRIEYPDTVETVADTPLQRSIASDSYPV
jgi:putative nucleotidyltransferase with HDIG domain